MSKLGKSDKDTKTHLEFWPFNGIAEFIRCFKNRANPEKGKGVEQRSRIMMLIGGGEIGTEIAIAALQKRQRRWLVRVIVDSEEIEPARNLARWYGIKNLPPRTRDCSASCDTPDFKTRFLYIPLKRPYNMTSLVECVKTYGSDVVILEDAFLTADEWRTLYSETRKSMKRQTPQFIPSPAAESAVKNVPQSDVFLSKVTMKELLGRVKDVDLLGDASEKVSIANLRHELEKGLQGEEMDRIERTIEKYGSIILKLEQTSSGHAQFVLTKTSDLTLERLNQQLEFHTRSRRAENTYFVMEKYLPNKIEACTIIATKPTQQTIMLEHIYYRKYGEGREKDKRFQGIARLAWSFTEQGRNDLWTKLGKITWQIAQNLKTPFLYVEFMLDLDSSVSNEPSVYVNEISYRPDDAGFISKISHKEDQFTIFVDSLENLLSRRKIEYSNNPEILLPEDSYSCETIIPGTKIQFDQRLRKNLTYEYPPHMQGIKSRNKLKLRLYEKSQSEGREKVTYGRILGYLMHLTQEDGGALLRTYQKQMDIPEEKMQLLIDALPNKADQELKRGLEFAKEMP